ncbi:Hamartin [Niveomyces insectorum RCEF 264]|uniref:Hamartin n=1 Tax=Niveomyces insectorum RCEF 264 TaxID=1081102 RepID=A0A167QWP0_9HYPO|nr:Hamartin [Niveomyces insectorum RCEF 264]
MPRLFTHIFANQGRFSSTRDLTKAVQAFATSPTLPLPDALSGAIQAYLDKHAEYDASASDRLQEDLLSIFDKTAPTRQPLFYASFLAVVRRLRPAIRSTDHLLQWWDRLIDPILNHLSEVRKLASDILADIEDFLLFDDSNDPDEKSAGDDHGGRDAKSSALNPIALRLLQKWMDVCHVVLVEGPRTSWGKEKPAETLLMLFGKKKPKEFFDALNDFFVRKSYRTRSISLVSEFVRSQPPHLHLITKSPLFDSLLRCLLQDTSTIVVSLALTSLTMLLPNMPGSIVPALPALFNIYARLLFWDRELAGLDNDAGGVRHAVSPDEEQEAADSPWEKCTFSPESDGTEIPHVLEYFNILYGLYPLNFMDYIRKPQRYLRHANATDTDEVEVQPSEIRDRSEKYRQLHLLHPNFYSLTIESEKTDFGRWMRSVTADIVSDCVALYMPLDRGPVLHADMEAGSAPAADSRLRDSGVRSSTSTGVTSSSINSRDPSAIIRRSSQSSMPFQVPGRDSSGGGGGGVNANDSSTLPPLMSQSASQTDLQIMINSNKAIKSGFYPSMENDSVPSLSLSHPESVPERLSTCSRVSLRPPSAVVSSSPQPASRAVGENNNNNNNHDNHDNHDNMQDLERVGEDTLTEMRRQILLLKNDLSFERYMTQQHLAHIGALRRSTVRHAVTEAETQKLFLSNRTLKNRLEEARKAESQVKKEAEMSRSRARNRDEALTSKLKKLRDEQKAWTAEEETLRANLRIAQVDNARLHALVCQAEVRELKTKQDMQMLESAAAEMDKLKEDVKALSDAKNASHRLQAQLEQTRDEAAKSESMLELLRMKLKAREAELLQTREYYEKQVNALNAELTEVLVRGGPLATHDANTGGTNPRALVESALAASRAKYLELQKNHTRLMRKYKVLESQGLERATAADYDEPLAYATSGPRGVDTSVSVASSDLEAEAARAFGTQQPFGSRKNSHQTADDGTSSIGAGSVGSSSGLAGAARHRQRMASDASGPSETTTSTPQTYRGANAVAAPTPTSPPNTVTRRPSTPSGPASRPEAVAGTSPQAERYYGRGGVQNSLRKERKDKRGDESADKKDKRAGGSGIRGIRGFI